MTTTPHDWPVTMPGADDDPRGPRGHADALLTGADNATVPIAREFATDGALPTSVRQAAREATSAIGEVRQHVHRAAGRLDELATDDLIPEKGRERLLGEAKGVAARALREVDGRSQTALDLLEAGLTATAQPTFPAGEDRAEAREEFTALVQAADDPAAAVRNLAAGQDQRLAALAAGTFGASTLRARGVDEPTIAATVTYAAQAGLQSPDPTRQAAARALTKVPELRKARAQALAAANFAIGWGD